MRKQRGLNTGRHNESAPELRGAAVSKPGFGSGRLGVDDLGLGLAVANWDLARFFCLGNFSHEIDVQQPVLETSRS